MHAAPVRGGAAPAPAPLLVGAPAELTLGPAGFDRRTGSLHRLADLELVDVRLGVWRAPIDNDLRSIHGRPLVDAWRAAGLDRLCHKLREVRVDAEELVVRTRAAAAGVDFALATEYRWSADADQVWLTVAVTPEGAWPCPLPRLGLALTLPGAGPDTEVAWFGLGPGEAYRDTADAARVGRYRSSVRDLQTPYVLPQENGNRRHVREARILPAAGPGLLLTGAPWFDLTARPWTTAALDAATHTVDLRPDGHLHLQLDADHHGIGSAACGPLLPAPHTLAAVPTTLTIGMTPC
ncbi:beta-galactosidase small subunit [Streptacidiphilus sp. EB129]|uniref:beta-galactosidase small subunit n=1 Tax=Streptacidiphilus sp. EB129 TaxID=3156262 RepID=UPI0035123A45